MPRFIGIHFRRAVQALAGFLVIVLGAIQVEELEQRLRVVGFTIGSVEQFRQKFQHLGRGPVRSRQFLHGRNERSPFPVLALESFQFPRQCHRFGIQLAVDHLSDQRHHLIDARRILLEQLPDQRLAVQAPIRGVERLRIQIAQF